jgi:hypothetical protein
MLAALLTPFAFVPLIVRGVQRMIHTPRIRWALGAAPVLGITALSLIFARSLDVLAPGVRIYAERTPWVETQLWARDHTSRDTVFMTPPYHWSFHESDWRVFSERASVVTMTELLEVVFAPRYFGEWKERFEVLAPNTISKFAGDPLRDRPLVENAYRALSDTQVVHAACRYGAAYLVDEKPIARAFPIAYENQEYVVYELPRAKC